MNEGVDHGIDHAFGGGNSFVVITCFHSIHDTGQQHWLSPTGCLIHINQAKHWRHFGLQSHLLASEPG